MEELKKIYMEQEQRDKALLSILITTYNRALILDKQLKMLKNYEENGLSFEIIVSNDCSSDNTEEVCMKWKDQFRKMKYIRLKERSGMDKNFMTVYESFDTEYCWLLGDHRMISRGGLKKLLDELEKHEHTAYILNCDKRLMRENRVYTEINELYSEQGWHITNNASCIIPKSFIKPELYKRHVGNTFLHLGIMIENLCFLGKFSVKYFPYITVRGLKIKELKNKRVGWTSHPYDNFCGWWVSFNMSLPCQITMDTKLKVLKDQHRIVKYFGWYHVFSGIYKHGNIYRDSFKRNRKYIHFVSDIPLWQYDIVMNIPLPLMNLLGGVYVKYILKLNFERLEYTEMSSTELR